MSSVALSRLLAFVAASASLALAQDPTSTPTPLADKHFNYPDQPYQADPDNGVRGTQSGFNICNSTTQNQDSLCQTAFLDFLDDFCLWSAPKPDSTIGETEHEEVAWCTQPKHGTRLIPAGALQGVQFIKTPGYLQVTGFIDQTKINLQADDFGGELDPHGADLRGNPLGGLVYSNNLPSKSGDNNTYTQVIEWHNFMGSNQFCMKVCDPADPQAPQLCQHIYDRIGVQYNCPSQPTNGTFEVCEGENQDPPGIFTSNGQVMTYTQPPESLGAITIQPYTVRMPASSNCVTFQSSDLYKALPTPSGASSASGASAIGTGASGRPVSGSATRTGSGAGPTATGAADTNAANTLKISAFATVFGALFAAAFLS
ncbi:unnamed protein product [Somion occarium]|uniref:Macrofage activating glycoprotein n=1 Tax=Somion occarium TaxID=3059160 RepID=A0ABP1EBS4_9APHY